MTSSEWCELIFEPSAPEDMWHKVFRSLPDLSRRIDSPDKLHNTILAADRFLSESAWELWSEYPENAPLTSKALTEWTNTPSSLLGKAVLIIDALSLRELPQLLSAAQDRDIEPATLEATGAEVPSETGTFAKALGLPQRSAAANDSAPASFTLFNNERCYTDVLSIPFEDCVGSVPNEPNVFLWHTWLDDLIHVHKNSSRQISEAARNMFKNDGFWKLLNKLRQGRKLLITSDHGYAVRKLFSAEERDDKTITALRDVFGASRAVPASGQWRQRFMPPVVLSHGGYHVIMGQCKWKVQGGFPEVCHGGLTLLEIAVPWIEFSPL